MKKTDWLICLAALVIVVFLFGYQELAPLPAVPAPAPVGQVSLPADPAGPEEDTVVYVNGTFYVLDGFPKAQRAAIAADLRHGR